MKVRERDLKHDADPVRFGSAMLICEGYAPDCSFHGKCARGGQCFASPAHLVAARMIESLLPNDGRSGMHYAYLRKVADLLRNDEIAL